MSYEQKAIAKYLSGTRDPFSSGYTEYKERLILDTMNDAKLMAAFRDGTKLPSQYGLRLDERVVEYPWVFSQLLRDGLILDAGSTFNKASLLAAPGLTGRSIVIYTLETDWITYNPKISYLFGDLREMILRDDVFQSVVCISTLEHVGFTYEYMTYSRRNPWPHAKPESYLLAVYEFRRILKPGGQLLLTVPYGKYENHGWLQQFDANMIERVKEAFAGTTVSEVYYRYTGMGWQSASKDDCSDLEYFNIHEQNRFDAEGTAAARAVCCLHLQVTK